MKYLVINSVYGVRSTGKIVMEQCHKLLAEGNQCMVGYGREAVEDEAVFLRPIGNRLDHNVHALFSRVLDAHGLCSKIHTEKFLAAAEEYQPDVIWLHNLHGYYINFELLFRWIKEQSGRQVFWTLHDCWPFTGHCAYFTMAQCARWKTGCHNCPQLHTYPKTYGPDRSRKNYARKKQAFTGVKNMKLIAPSKWLADLTRNSFLAEYPVKVIHNTIDTDIFKPTDSGFRTKYNLQKCFIVLGVAVGWETSKGFQDMLQLRDYLPEEYRIVLVGVTDQQRERLPEGISGISSIADQTELAEIYTAADVFVNPTHQDNYPTVNLEAAACGTPVVTYDVGGSPESVLLQNVIKENDIPGLADRIIEICREKKQEP